MDVKVNVGEDCEMLELETENLKTPSESSNNSTKEIEKSRKEMSTTVIKDETKALYVSLKIDVNDPRIMTFFRLDTVFLQGVDDMSTSEVYEFFEPLKPLSLEWINDSCCNAVWADDDTAAQAILNVALPDSNKTYKEIFDAKDQVKQDSQKIILLGEEEDNESSEDGELPEVGPEIVWRMTTNSHIKIRFANWDDKKVRGAEKHSEYYKKYGNPNFGGLKGLISGSRKRKLRSVLEYTDLDLPSISELDIPKYHDLDLPSSVDVTPPVADARLRISQIVSGKTETRDVTPKRPKMKMYADEEEKKTNTPKSSHVTKRLGNILVNVSRDSESDELDDLELSSPREFGPKSVWDRLQVEVPNSHEGKKKESRKSRNNSNVERQKDLRKKLQRIRDDRGNEHRSPLLVKGSQD